MTLSTLIHAGLVRPSEPRTALVLMGGGARTAYQAGALQAIGQILALRNTAKPFSPSGAPPSVDKFPFQVLVGTSAGALNASFLAAHATQGLTALQALAQFWQTLQSAKVYRLEVSPWVRLSKIAAAWHLSRQIRSQGALLDSMPLVNTLHNAVPLEGIENALASGALYALAVTASSYTSGVHWTFCHTRNDARQKAWSRPGRRSEFGPISIEHLMASSAIPLLFPPTPLWVDQGCEYFGDGSMRQILPLSPAMHLGAHKILVIGVGQPQRSSFAGLDVDISAHSPSTLARGAPSMGGIMGHAMASVFHDTLQSDVEQAQRMNATLQELPREIAAVLPYRSVQVMSLQPSESLDDIAQQHAHELPRAARNALAGLGADGSGGAAALASYLLFESGFIKTLMAMGERDAYAHKTALLEFFSDGVLGA